MMINRKLLYAQLYVCISMHLIYTESSCVKEQLDFFEVARYD